MSLPYLSGDKASAVRQSGPRQPKRTAGGSRHASPAPPPQPYDDDNTGEGDTEDDVLATTGNSGATSTTSHAHQNRRDVADFRILVAARIRPFTQREVRQWRQERRAAEAHDDELEEARRTRTALRQPFGPDYKSLNATHAGLDGTWTRRHDNSDDHHGGGPGSNRGSVDANDVPRPIVEVESDGKTVVLLDAQSLLHDNANGAGGAGSGGESGAGGNGGLPSASPVRNAFTYDYVYSSFAPNVELDAQLVEGSPTGRLEHGTPPCSSGHASSYVIMDGDNNTDGDGDGDGGGSTSTAVMHGGASSAQHTPAQEAQAEAEQVAIYEQLAVPLVDAALQGYNTCMFAYGQTGSGKTYTMMGTLRHPGLIPRLCQLLFAEVAARNNSGGGGAAAAAAAGAPSQVTLQLSYMEIYNEQVRDLLKQRPKNAILRYKSRFDKKDVDSDEYRTLKVRHHPSKGIYVDGLTSVPVGTWGECEAYLQLGNALRTQCSTAMNAKSSRSHAIFQLQMTQRESTGGRVRGREVALETFSKINLVDLAGSERNTQSKTTGKHLAEANSINASLSTLRRVLDALIANRALAQANNPNNNNNGRSGSGKKGTGVGAKTKKLGGGSTLSGGVVIPYRESLLTYVLSDNLGGNSFTVMCANVSPCAASAGETESTLRYATLAKSVVNHAKLNEAPAARVLREMRDQLRVMQEALRNAPDPSHVAELEEGVQLSEELLREMKGREEGYEAQLQAQAAQAAALRDAVEAHKRQEAYWRAEAERQQREVEELREALFEATQNGGSGIHKNNNNKSATSLASSNAAGMKGNGQTAGAAAAKSAGSLHLPSLRAIRTPSSGEMPGGTPPQHPSKQPQQRTKRQSSLEHDDDNNNSGALSPSSRDWKPTRVRGTPLSLMSLRDGAHRPSRDSLPSLQSGAPSSAPEKNLDGGAGGRLGAGNGRRGSRTTSNTTVTAPSSGQPRRPSLTVAKAKAAAPRPPLSKPQRSSNPRAHRGGAVAAIEAEDDDVALPDSLAATAHHSGGVQSIHFSTREPSGTAGYPGFAAADDNDDAETARALLLSREVDDRADPPPFFQTEQFLTHVAASAGEVEELSEAPSSARLPHGSDATPPQLASPPQRKPHPSRTDGLEAGELLDIQQLQIQAEVFRRASGAGGVLEIEGVAATPSKQQWPTHSPGVAAARQAQAARDRRRSSLTAAAAPPVTSKKKGKKVKEAKAKRSAAPSTGKKETKLASREASAEPPSPRAPEDTSMSAELVNRDADNFQRKHPAHETHLMNVATTDDDDAQALTPGASRSPHGDEGLTDMHSSNALPHDHDTNFPRDGDDNGDDGEVDTRLVSAGDGDNVAHTSALHDHLELFHHSGADADFMHDGYDDDNPVTVEDDYDEADPLSDPADEHVYTQNGSFAEELCADDTESAAASLNRSGNNKNNNNNNSSAKAAEAPPQLQKKKKNKKTKAGAPVSGRHYSTVDTLQ